MVNSLQSVFAQAKQEFDLPQIVVVGSQSSGKSTVIESLVGHGDFLPRGRGIVTRCPLILQMVQQPVGMAPWGEFMHDERRFSGKRFTNFAEIRSTIRQETDRIAGKNRGVSKQPLILRVHSPNTVPLTLVDTPGLTRIAVGDQPSDIQEQITDMVSSFIRRPNSIILAVTPANVDLATSDALRLAKKFDPSGERTIGVLTKLDLMDRGADALDVLSGRVYRLQLGFVGVVGRSQYDIDNNKTLEEALQDEQKFFAQSPVYSRVATVNGVSHLASRCNQLLVQHIKKVLPQLKDSIQVQSRELKRDLARIGRHSTPSDPANQGYLMLRLIEEFAASFRSAIDGSSDRLDLDDAADDQQLNGGARIRNVFNEEFGKTLENIDPLKGLSDRDIVQAIRNAAGPKPSLFLPEKAFERLAKRSIRKLHAPAMQCVERVHAELLKIMLDIDRTTGIVQFPVLSEKILESGQQMLGKTKSTSALITEIIDAECSYINTNHKDFVGLKVLKDPTKFKYGENLSQSGYGSDQRQQQQQQQQELDGGSSDSQHSTGFFSSFFGRPAGPSSVRQDHDSGRSSMALPQSATEREKFQVSLLKTLLTSYFDVVRKNVQDITIKLVWKNVVETSTKELQRALMADLYKPELFPMLLRENPQVLSQRMVWQERLDALKKAKNIISLAEIREE